MILLLLLALAGPVSAQPAMVPIAKEEATPILGQQVLDRDGQPAGRIVNVLVDGAGQARAAVVDFGGFLGVGQRRIAVAWSALRFDPGPRTITLMMSAAEIAGTPEFNADSGGIVVTPKAPE